MGRLASLRETCCPRSERGERAIDQGSARVAERVVDSGRCVAVGSSPDETGSYDACKRLAEGLVADAADALA
jgi:hypothetical protein